MTEFHKILLPDTSILIQAIEHDILLVKWHKLLAFILISNALLQPSLSRHHLLTYHQRSWCTSSRIWVPGICAAVRKWIISGIKWPWMVKCGRRYTLSSGVRVGGIGHVGQGRKSRSKMINSWCCIKSQLWFFLLKN